MRFRARTSADGGSSWSAWSSLATTVESSLIPNATTGQRVEVEIYVQPPTPAKNFYGLFIDTVLFNGPGPLTSPELHRIARRVHPAGESWSGSTIDTAATTASFFSTTGVVVDYAPPAALAITPVAVNSTSLEASRNLTADGLPWFLRTLPADAAYLRTVGVTGRIPAGVRADIAVAEGITTKAATTGIVSSTRRLLAAWFSSGLGGRWNNWANPVSFSVHRSDDTTTGANISLHVSAPGRGAVDEGSVRYTSIASNLRRQATGWWANSALAAEWVAGYLRFSGAGILGYTRTTWDWDPGSLPIPASYRPGDPLADITSDWLLHTITMLETSASGDERMLCWVAPRNFSTDTVSTLAIPSA